MITERFAARSALGVATLALGLSAWSVGCRDRGAETQSAAPQPRTVTVSASASPVAVQPPAAPPAAKSTPVADEVIGLPSLTGSPKPAKPEAALTGDFSVKRLVVTRGIAKREPMTSDGLTAGDGPMYAFVELQNPTPEPRTVEVTFKRDGTSGEVGHIKLEVPANAKRWRTWGRTTLVDKAGQWTAVVRGADGNELARTPFEVASR